MAHSHPTSQLRHPALVPRFRGQVRIQTLHHWKVSKKSIVGVYKIFSYPCGYFCLMGYVDFVFSPDVKYVAAISEDGCLRVIDAIGEQYVCSAYHLFLGLTSRQIG